MFKWTPPVWWPQSPQPPVVIELRIDVVIPDDGDEEPAPVLKLVDARQVQ